MTDILFTHSYFYKLDPKQWKTKQPYPPLGTILAAAWLRQHQYNISLFDTNLSDHPKEIIPWLWKHNPSYVVIYDDGFNYLTKMCLTTMREAAFQMIHYAREYNCQVIVCSSDSTDQYEKYLDQGADFVIRGEGEQTLLELVNALENKHLDISCVNGLAYRKNGQTLLTQPRAIEKELDQFPLPAWDLLDIQSYKKIWMKQQGYFSLNIATTRGCPFKCNWCAKPIYGNRYHSRSPEKVVEEIEYLIRQFGATHFWVCDDIFGLKPGWVQRFSELVRAKNLRFRYKIQSRADLLLKEDTVQDLVDSGLDIVWIGAESGTQKILDAMDKGIKVEQIYESTRLIQQKGAKVAFFIQFGYPGENKEDIRKTCEMVLDLLPDDIGVSVSYPLPGTKFYEKVKEELHHKTHWKDSDDLAMLFNNTYPPEFYKRLHRYLHKIYRRKKSLIYVKSLFQRTSAVTLFKKFWSVFSLIYYSLSAYVDRMVLNKLQSRSDTKTI